ncbi:PREDICTED: tiggrin [Rhagoletis zephyria]|uniref:tiggrin n=1 Tax=Rhagoletis zephyria TaxID=28612 RepID=UPI000811797D|nr:PREDICTED: tiggrin [Rhagoletis zephyria]
MKALSLLLALLCVAQWRAHAYIVGSTSGYSHSSRYASSSSSSSASGSSSCCQLSSWAYAHINEVRQFATRLRQEYNYMSQGTSTGYSVQDTQWDANIISLTGKTGSELDALVRRVSEQLVTDMRKGLLPYTTIIAPNFFESKAAETLETYTAASDDYGQQQQQIEVGHFQPVDLSNFDEVRNYAYPAEVKVIDGKTYVVHKNCTEAKKVSGDGTYGSPLVTVRSRNRTTIATSGGIPAYTYGTGGYSSGSLVSGSTASYPSPIYAQPGTSSSSTSTTLRRKNTVYDWVNQNMEPSVMGYNPVVNVAGSSNWQAGAYQPATNVPFDADVEALSAGSPAFRPSYAPGSTVTVRRFNKTIITNPDGTNTVSGSELNRKWVDGKLVYDSQRPFGEWTVPRGEAWKQEERERFFWFLTQGNITPQRLEEWQRQQEERLLATAERHHTTIENIQAWHRDELDRYRVLLGQYQAQNSNLTGWKRTEAGRLDWLIHQNSVTREELERWQRENNEKLVQLARQYNISLQELKNWQIEELNRLYAHFNDQNNSLISRPIDSGSLRTSEQERLEELIRQHNATITQLQNSIRMDQEKLTNLGQKYRGNVQDMEKWLKGEMARLNGIINEQRNEMTRVTEWQRSERERLENVVKQHRGSVEEVEAQMARDRNYMQALAAKYHVSLEELEKWQSSELDRLHNESQTKLELDIQEWQRREREHLKSIVNKNDLTIEEFQAKIMSDRSRLEDLAKTYKIQVSEVEEWIRNEIKNFQSQGLLKEVEKELAAWQQKERERLNSIVRQNELTVEELETKIKADQTHLYSLANTYQVRVEEIEEWLKKELLRLQGEGLIKVEDLKDWQRQEREDILKIVQENKLTIEEFEKKLLADRQRLQDLARTYNVQTSEIEGWIKKEGERLQSLGLLQIQEQLSNWQKIERDRLLELVNKNNLSIDELQESIKKDRQHLYTLAHQNQVRVEEVEEWIKKEIQKLQAEGLIEMEKLKDWQSQWRGNLTNMVKERDFTVEEFHKWLLEDRKRLQDLAMQHNVQIEEIEQWVRNEEQRFISMGLLKPNEKLTNWQAVERRYLERITQEQYHSTEQLEQRLRQDRELLEKLARDYSVQVEEIEQWMKKELARLRDDGQLQIDNLTAWQIAERARLEELVKQNKAWSVEEFESVLRQDREHMQKMAFQYHTSVEEIEKWIQSEVDRLRQQGKLDIEKLTEWQKTEHDRILNLLQQQSTITVEEFEEKVQKDRRFLINLANQYHVSVVEVEAYVKKVIDELRNKGKFEVENLQNWQLVERDYIKQLIGQYQNGLSTTEYEQKLLADRAHLHQLADQYRISIDQIEKWMIEELKRLRKDSADHVQKLAEWQVAEAQRLKELIRQNNHLSYVEFQMELNKERQRLQELARQYSVSVEEVETWLRQQLVNLKATGQVQVESLTQWQSDEQKRLIDMLLQQQNSISYDEFESQLRRDRAHLQSLAQEYSVSVEQIEAWMRDELQRLKNTGLLQVEQLTYWQKSERDRLQDWLNRQNNATTYEEFNEFLRRDKARLERIAQDYQVTVEEVESWVQQEGARLQVLGLIKGPQNYAVYEDHSGNDEWKVYTLAHLKAVAQTVPMNWQDFENYLVKERMRWEQFARQYNVSVEEIEEYIREEAQKLNQQGVITGSVTVEEWEFEESQHIQNLINDRLRKQQRWSIEELERQLRQDQEHLRQLAIQYHVTVEEAEAWYRQELQRLLDQNKIISEHLVDWQRREKDRLYRLVTRQPGVTVEVWEEQILRDRTTLNNLADEYHVSIEELESWINNELRRLADLGLVRNLHQSSDYNNWQKQESERLRSIAAEINITQIEFLEFIAADTDYQRRLAKLYGTTLEQLAPFQSIEISHLQREGLLDNTKLLTLEQWQKRERDRLYNLIKNQNFSLKNLRNWQRQDMFLNEVAANYGITTQALKDWQIKEFERFIQLAEHYGMTLNQLQDFRDKEWRYINFVMHKKTSNEAERINWGAEEAKRMAVLERKTGLAGEELLEWRRILYLLCQGLLPMDSTTGFGGHEIGAGSTNRTAWPHNVISKDRGDQPPHVYDENGDVEEPGLAGQDNALYPLPNAAIKEETTTQYPAYPAPYAPLASGGRTSGYRYSKKEYKYTVPAGGVNAVASADASSSATSASANIGLGGRTRYGRERELDTQLQQQQQQKVDDYGQQQQVEVGWNGKLEDGGQQQEVDLGWNAQQQQQAQFGYGRSSSGGYTSSSQQSQQQQEDFGQQQQVELGDYKQHDWDQQQQVQVEDLSGSFTGAHSSYNQKQVSSTEANAHVEVTAEPESTGLWGSIKKKASGIFG